MDKERIARINFLARKSRAEGLSPEEAAEQAELRAAYIADFRAGLRGTLENTYIERPDGTREKLQSNKSNGQA